MCQSSHILWDSLWFSSYFRNNSKLKTASFYAQGQVINHLLSYSICYRAIHPSNNDTSSVRLYIMWFCQQVSPLLKTRGVHKRNHAYAHCTTMLPVGARSIPFGLSVLSVPDQYRGWASRWESDRQACGAESDGGGRQRQQADVPTGAVPHRGQRAGSPR